MARVLLRYQGPPGGVLGWSPGQTRAVDEADAAVKRTQAPPGWWVELTGAGAGVFERDGVAPCR